MEKYVLVYRHVKTNLKLWNNKNRVNKLRFGRFKSQNACHGVLYLLIKFNRNQILVGLQKLYVNLLPLDWTACMCGSPRHGHITLLIF
jgi:hypothetical protein